MQESDKHEFETIIKATAEMYSAVKKVEISVVMMKLFFASLREFTVEQVSYGFERHLSDPVDGRFFPKPANIIKYLKPAEISTEEKAELAWAQIEREIRVTGSWGKLKMDDKQGLAALKAFTSWKGLCGMDTSKMTWAKKEFISMYSTYENTPVEMLPSSLPGRVELLQHKEKGLTCLSDVLEGINKRRLTKE